MQQKTGLDAQNLLLSFSKKIIPIKIFLLQERSILNHSGFIRWQKNRTRQPVTPAWISILKPEEVARATLDALMDRKSVLILPTAMRVLRILAHFIPGWVDRLMQESTGLMRS